MNLDWRMFDEMRLELDRDFTPQKVKTVVDQMPVDKSSCPDGLSATFYKKHWDIIGADFTHVIFKILKREGRLMRSIKLTLSLFLRKRSWHRPLSLDRSVSLTLFTRFSKKFL